MIVRVPVVDLKAVAVQRRRTRDGEGGTGQGVEVDDAVGRQGQRGEGLTDRGGGSCGTTDADRAIIELQIGGGVDLIVSTKEESTTVDIDARRGGQATRCAEVELGTRADGGGTSEGIHTGQAVGSGGHVQGEISGSDGASEGRGTGQGQGGSAERVGHKVFCDASAGQALEREALSIEVQGVALGVVVTSGTEVGRGGRCQRICGGGLQSTFSGDVHRGGTERTCDRDDIGGKPRDVRDSFAERGTDVAT